MSQAGSLSHIQLYEQNKSKDDISISLKGQFTVPAIVVIITKLHDSDMKQLRDTLVLTEGTHDLVLAYKGGEACIGKVFNNLTNYCCITNAIENCTVYEVKEAPEDDGEYQLTELTMEDMISTITIGTQHLKEYPEVHVDFLKTNYMQYKELIVENKELFADFISEHYEDFKHMIEVKNDEQQSRNLDDFYDAFRNDNGDLEEYIKSMYISQDARIKIF